MIRVLTVRQPYAWAIIHGGKDVENRGRNVAGDYRGPVAIHVALKASLHEGHSPVFPPLMAAANEYRRSFERIVLGEADAPWWDNLGLIIGVVDLVGVHTSRDRECARLLGIHETGEQDWAAGCSSWAEHDRTHLVLANSRPLSAPIPFKGALHLQTAPEAVEAEIVRQIGPIH